MSHFAGVRNHSEARARYHDLCRQYHPDRMNAIMQEINAEYERVKGMSDDELGRQADLLDRAVSHLSTRQEAQEHPPAPVPEPPKPARKFHIFRPSRAEQERILEQQRLMNLPCPEWYTLDQRRAYAREQDRQTKRSSDIDKDNDRRAHQDEAEAKAAEARSEVARRMK